MAAHACESDVTLRCVVPHTSCGWVDGCGRRKPRTGRDDSRCAPFLGFCRDSLSKPQIDDFSFEPHCLPHYTSLHTSLLAHALHRIFSFNCIPRNNTNPILFHHLDRHHRKEKFPRPAAKMRFSFISALTVALAANNAVASSWFGKAGTCFCSTRLSLFFPK